MIRVCYSRHHQGDRVIGEKEPLEDKRITHGLCDSCLAKEIEEIEKWKAERKEAPAGEGQPEAEPGAEGGEGNLFEAAQNLADTTKGSGPIEISFGDKTITMADGKIVKGSMGDLKAEVAKDLKEAGLL